MGETTYTLEMRVRGVLVAVIKVKGFGQLAAEDKVHSEISFRAKTLPPEVPQLDLTD